MTKKQYRELVEKVTKGLLTCMDNSTEACRKCPYWRGEDGKFGGIKMKADALLLIVTGRRK